MFSSPYGSLSFATICVMEKQPSVGFITIALTAVRNAGKLTFGMFLTENTFAIERIDKNMKLRKGILIGRAVLLLVVIKSSRPMA